MSASFAALAAEAANTGRSRSRRQAQRMRLVIVLWVYLGARGETRVARVSCRSPRTGGSMPAYLIVNYEVEDPALYGEYAKGAGPAMKIGTECQLLALDPASERLEGNSSGRQTVILQFESKEKAKAL